MAAAWTCITTVLAAEIPEGWEVSVTLQRASLRVHVHVCAPVHVCAGEAGCAGPAGECLVLDTQADEVGNERLSAPVALLRI